MHLSESTKRTLFRVSTLLAVHFVIMGGLIAAYAALTGRTVGQALGNVWIPTLVSFVFIIVVALRWDKKTL